MADPDLTYAAWGAGAGSIIQIFGMLEAGKLARADAKRRKQAAEFAAWQADQQAQTVVAISQRQAEEERRKQVLMESHSLAVAAASGGGASDASVVRLVSGLAGQGAYRVSAALYEGQERARQLKLNAAAERLSGSYDLISGASRAEGFDIQAIGKGVVTGATLYAKYGNSGGSGDAALIESFEP